MSIGPVNGDAANIINSVNRDKMLSYDDKEGIKNNIIKYHDMWKNNNLKFIYDKSDISNFSRLELTNNLAKVLDKIYGKNN